MPIVLNGSTGITTNNLGVETIVDTDGTGAPSVPNGFEQMFVLPVGTLMWFTGTTAPGGYLVADGSLHSRAAYPDLWSWIVTSGNLAVSDALWDEGQYSPGDGSTTFRVPKVDDRFIRGKSATRAVGLVEEDAFQGHWHGDGTTSTVSSVNSAAADGFINSGNSSWTQKKSAIKTLVSDGINGTPRTANETRPKALTMLPCIKAFDSVIEPSVLNAAEMVSTINGKLDKSDNIVLGTSVTASGTAVDFVGIPEGVKRITVMFDGVRHGGSDTSLRLQLGSDSVEDTGYIGGGARLGTNSLIGAFSTTGFDFSSSGTTTFNSGICTLLPSLQNTWLFAGQIGAQGGQTSAFATGKKALSGTLDRIRITTVNGTNTFDAGTINISWEF